VVVAGVGVQEADGCRLSKQVSVGTTTDEVTMSRPAMEQVLGELIMDARFRDAFFRDPLAATLAARVELTARERDALGHIRPGALAGFQRDLDGKWIRDGIEEVSA
jgi:hypothetical protein